MCGKDTLKLETNAESSKVCSTSQHSSFQQYEVSGIDFVILERAKLCFVCL